MFDGCKSGAISVAGGGALPWRGGSFGVRGDVPYGWEASPPEQAGPFDASWFPPEVSISGDPVFVYPARCHAVA